MPVIDEPADQKHNHAASPESADSPDINDDIAPDDFLSRAGVAFQHRDFRWFQTARLLIMLGTEMLSVAIGWQVYELTHRPLDLGYVGLAQFLPAFFLILAAGHVADRFDRRRILLVCFVVYGICTGMLLTLTLRGNRSTTPIFAVLLLIGVVRSFSGPAAQSLMPQLVPAEHFPNAVMWAASTFQAGSIMGPAAGGVIYAIAGPAAVLWSSLAMYAVAWFCVWHIHARTGRMEKRDISIETVLAGLRFVWKQKVVLGSISMDLFAVLLGGAVALMPVYAKDILRVGSAGFGMMRASPAIGAVIMAVLLAHRPMRRRAGVIMLWCVTGFGAATIVFGLSRNFLLSLVALFFIGATDMVSMVVRGTLVQLFTPPEMRGRVSAVNLLFIGASNEFGQFESGVTAQWFGTVPAVVLGGIGSIVVVALWARLFPEIRKVQTLGEKKS